MGYGSRALQALNSYYSGELLNLDEVMAEMEIETFEDVAKVDEVGLYHLVPEGTYAY
jgi:N-acetyltransferase 10